MATLPLTRASLLVRIQDQRDAEAWRQFFDLYAPVVYGFARKRGLQDADAADLMQDVLRSVAGAAGRLNYDPGKGTFRGWLFTVTRNKVFNFLDRIGERGNSIRLSAGGRLTRDTGVGGGSFSLMTLIRLSQLESVQYNCSTEIAEMFDGAH